MTTDRARVRCACEGGSRRYGGVQMSIIYVSPEKLILACAPASPLLCVSRTLFRTTQAQDTISLSSGRKPEA